MRNPSYFHYKKNKADGELRTVVTVAYTFNLRTSQLRYGGTIYKKTGEKEQWNRKKHIDRARERYNDNPVIFKFGPLTYVPHFHNYRRLENFIRQYCVTNFGVEYHEDRDPNNDKEFQNNIDLYTYDIFNPFLTVKEIHSLASYNEEIGKDSNSLCKKITCSNTCLFILMLISLMIIMGPYPFDE